MELSLLVVSFQGWGCQAIVWHWGEGEFLGDRIVGPVRTSLPHPAHASPPEQLGTFLLSAGSFIIPRGHCRREVPRDSSAMAPSD